MQAAVKAHRTKFKVEGDIPGWLLDELKKRYSKSLQVTEDESINIRDSGWFASTKVSPGEAVRLLRRNRGLSQVELAHKLGLTVRKSHVSDMERGRREISKAMAKKLAAIFSTSVERFI